MSPDHALELHGIGRGAPLGAVWQLERDALGRPVRRRDPFGVERTTSYRPEGWIERVRTSGPSGLLDETVYAGHDALGNPASITTAEGTTQLEYDPRHRVRQIAYPARSGWPACGTACERFAYDRAGNRTLHEKDGAERRAVVDAANDTTGGRHGT
jgi:YD repeat-containing protein